MKKKFTVYDVVLYSIMFLGMVVVLTPFAYIINASISKPSEVFSNPMLFLPKGPTLKTYELLFSVPSLMIGYSNSIWYTVVGTLISVTLTILTAYGLSQKWLYGRKIFMIIIILTMFVSGGIIPSYLVVKWTGLLFTRWALVIPTAISTWNLIIARTYFENNIPDELHEAAEIDGANEYMIFAKVVLPLSLPIIAVITLFYAADQWNSYFNAMLYLKDRMQFPLQLFIRELLVLDMSADLLGDMATGRAEYTLTLKYAMAVAAIIPMLIVLPIVQRYFVKGIMIGALKE